MGGAGVVAVLLDRVDRARALLLGVGVRAVALVGVRDLGDLGAVSLERGRIATTVLSEHTFDLFGRHEGGGIAATSPQTSPDRPHQKPHPSQVRRLVADAGGLDGAFTPPIVRKPQVRLIKPRSCPSSVGRRRRHWR